MLGITGRESKLQKLSTYRSLELEPFSENGELIKRSWKNFESSLLYNSETGFMTFYPKPQETILDDFYSSDFMRGEKDPTPESEYTPTMLTVAKGVIDHMNSLYLKDHWNIYDVGCGYGALVWAWQQLGHSAWGNELNPTWVSEANEFCNDQIFFGNLDQGLKSIDCELDLFLISHVLEHVLDPAKILEEAASRLSKTGLIYVSTPNTKCLRVFANGRTSGIDFGNFPMHLNFFTPASIKKIGESVGLKLIQMDTRPFDEIETTNSDAAYQYRYNKRFLGGELFSLFVGADSELAERVDTSELYEKIRITNTLFPIIST